MLTKLKLFRSRRNREALRRITFTNVLGEVLGNYEADKSHESKIQNQ